MRTFLPGFGLAVLVIVSGAFAQTPPPAFPPPGVTSAAEMPLLRGDLWQKMTLDEKVAFVWGVGHVVTVERVIDQKHPELKNQGFADKLADGLMGIPMNDVIRNVDRFYTSNPDRLNEPVMRVIWDTTVRPRLTTGIGGRPLR